MAFKLEDIFVEFSARTRKFRKGLGEVTGALKGFNQSIKKMDTDSKLAFAAVGASGVLAFRSILTAAGDFDAAMRSVRAVSGATADEFRSLSEVAKELGRTTQFSASEAAAGMEFLAKAGFETNEILGAIPGTLQLAAAASLELGEAADIVSNVLTGFNLDVKELARVNDVLVKTFISSNTNLQQLGQSLKFAGPVAAAMGQDFEETVAILGKMGDAGIQASMAGTSLRAALARLAAPTKKISGILNDLEVNTRDSSGAMRPLLDILDDMQKAGIDSAQALEIFGLRAGPAMLSLLQQGIGGVRELAAELRTSAGTAAEIAAAKMAGFNGAMKELTSAFEGVKIAIGESGLLEFATKAARALAGLLRAVSEISPTFLIAFTAMAAAVTTLATSLAVLGIAAPAATAGLATIKILTLSLATAITGTTTALAAFKVALTVLTGPLGIALGAVVLLTAGIIKLRDARSEEADANARSARGIKEVTDRMREGFNTSRMFAGMTARQALELGNQKEVVDKLTVGIQGLTVALLRAGNAQNALKIKARIEELKALRVEVLKNSQAQASATGKELTDAEKKAMAEKNRQALFRADVAERRSLLKAEAAEAKVQEDVQAQAKAERRLVELEAARIDGEEFKALIVDKTEAEIIELTRLAEVKTLARETDLAEQQVFDQARTLLEASTRMKLNAIAQQAETALTALFSKNLSVRQKRQQIFTQAMKSLQGIVTKSVISALAKQVAAKQASSAKGVAADAPETASGFFKAFAGLGPFGIPLALASIATAFAFISRLVTFQRGGVVPGFGATDKVPALLTPGEVVLPRGARIGGAGIGRMVVNIINPIVDSDERLEEMAERVGDVFMDKLLLEGRIAV